MNIVEQVQVFLAGGNKPQSISLDKTGAQCKRICPKERADDIHERATEQVTITTRKAKAIAAQAQNILDRGIS